MNIMQIENNIKELLSNFNPDTFIYDLLLAYGLPKSYVTKLYKGNLNISRVEGVILWKKKVFFHAVASNSLYSTIDDYKTDQAITKNDPRFIIVTDYKQLLAYDTKLGTTLDVAIAEFGSKFDFFLPWAGLEKATYQGENPADVKAAQRMAKLFDIIREDNLEFANKQLSHSLNVFLSRLLFCFFAEDTGIFTPQLFTESIKNYTQVDGSDLDGYLDKIFAVMNQSAHQRDNNLADYITRFPYVNGGLFRDNYKVPRFTSKSRQLLIDNGELDWSVINPDIFGSMMQAVVDSGERSSLGMHYTSVPNIMKVIEPLFLNDFREELDNASESKGKLEKLLDRISKVKLFDPACGSGNFLIITYKELRKLEIEILHRLIKLRVAPSLLFSRIQLHNFYGIEIDDFAHEIAKLSLWLAEHQMNMLFENDLGARVPALPLRESGNIVCVNACRIAWEEVCPKNPDDEIYVFGNPPYLGGKMQSEEQKYDFEVALQDPKYPKNLDYISIWFIKGANYIKSCNNIKLAFVTTNSICQGDHVGLLWPKIFNLNIEIFFAHQSFKWVNNAKHNAGVSVAIVGLRSCQSGKFTIYKDNNCMIVNNINAYLYNSKNIIVHGLDYNLSNLNKMVFGCMARDGGGLFLSEAEKNELLLLNPNARKFIKQIIGSQELLYREKRYCLWIDENQFELANSIDFIKNRLEKVRLFRAMSKAESTRKYADKPYRFVQISYKNSDSIIIPKVSSELREYLQIDFISSDIIISDLAFAIYNAKPYLFGIISSKMHMAWVKAIGGRLGTGIRYSSTLCYNTFPFPAINEEQKQRITHYVYEVLDEREKHSEKTLAQLYDPDKMPAGLRQAHTNLDNVIELCYRTKPFTSDEERLEHLFALYEKMTAKCGG